MGAVCRRFIPRASRVRSPPRRATGPPAPARAAPPAPARGSPARCRPLGRSARRRAAVLACGLSVGWRLIRTPPSATQPEQAARTFMNRAHHSHLSNRCHVRSSASLIALDGCRSDARAANGSVHPHRDRLRSPDGRGWTPSGRHGPPASGAPAGRDTPGSSVTPGTTRAPPSARSTGGQQLSPDRQAGGQVGRQRRRPPPRRMRKFGRDPLGDIQPQQHRPGVEPAQRRGETRAANWPAPASRPGRAAGNSGGGKRCATDHSIARSAIARGFSAAGLNRPNRPARTPSSFNRARSGGATCTAWADAARLAQLVQGAAQRRVGDGGQAQHRRQLRLDRGRRR